MPLRRLVDFMLSSQELKQWLTPYLNSSAFKRKLILISSIFTLVFLFFYWIYSQFHVSTEDAYINANIVQITPQITGRVQHVYVENNQFVKKGQLLFDIEATPFEISVAKAQAQLALARQAVAEKNASVLAATAQVAVREAERNVAKSTAERTMKLVARKVLSQQTGDDVTANFQRATAILETAKANLEQAKMVLGKLGDDNEQIQLAAANLHEAELNLSYTHITAPHDGIIANLSLQAGTVVAPNQPLFALISEGHYWVDANLKETDLKNIKPGQKADVEVDMYPGHTFHGIVESISGGSGTAFSLLPAQNASGNWVKVTQRVPVRITIININTRYPLRIGTSASVKIRT